VEERCKEETFPYWEELERNNPYRRKTMVELLGKLTVAEVLYILEETKLTYEELEKECKQSDICV
jgi:hypothetical protein